MSCRGETIDFPLRFDDTHFDPQAKGMVDRRK